MSTDLKTTIKDGQRYVDEPVYVDPKREPFDVLRASVALALGGQKEPPKHSIVVRHERVRLRWLRPNGRGNLVER